MTKLYYTPTSCGAASFISAHIAGVQLETEQVDIRTHVTSSGTDFYGINRKGNVPALVLEDGTVLNENVAVQLWIADQKIGAVAPAPGTPERYVLLNALSYVATEVHPAVGSFFMPNAAPDVTVFFRTRVATKLNYLSDHFIGDRRFVVGDSFTIVDSYLYIVLSWTQYVGIDLNEYPKVKAYYEGIANLPNVKAAHARIAENPATAL